MSPGVEEGKVEAGLGIEVHLTDARPRTKPPTCEEALHPLSSPRGEVLQPPPWALGSLKFTPCHHHRWASPLGFTAWPSIQGQ